MGINKVLRGGQLYPLYVWREFKKPAVNRGSLWINEIEAFCEICDQLRPFRDLRSRGGSAGMVVEGLKAGISYFEFTCVSCRKARREFLVEQIVTEETIRIQKYGERPKKPLTKDHVLQHFLKDDLKNYEKAVDCLSHQYGVAAFVYLRRVIENNINRLLDLIQEDAKSSAASAEVIRALAELRKESRMSEKIRIAKYALPGHLKPDGLNPLGKLYQVLSEGAHNLSDEECLDRAKASSGCLAFLVSELVSRKEHRSRFKSMVGEL